MAVGGQDALTRVQLDHEAGRLAAQLHHSGVGEGGVVCALLPNSPDFVVALLATWKLGAVFAPLNPQLTAVERQRAMEVARPRVMVEAGGITRCDHLAEPPEPAPGAGDALLLFTSGSTGTPKGVLLSNAAVESGVRAVVDTFGLGPDDRTLALLPWTHGHGLIGVLLASLAAGARVDLDDARGLAGALAGRLDLATWLSAVPPTLAMLADRQERSPSRARLRFIRTASAPLSLPLATRTESLFGCPVAEAYGMTETCHQAAANPPDSHRQLGTVGLPTRAIFRHVGDEIGGGRELEVRGAGLFRGYLGRPDLTEAAVTGDGWYRTRDIGVIQPDGFVRLIARTSDIINRGGFKVSPGEVEASLASHPAVSASLVAAVPHAVLGEEIGALVVVRPGVPLTVADLRRHCRQELAGYKQPGVIKIVAEIPRLANGKPSRRLAADLLQAAP